MKKIVFLTMLIPEIMYNKVNKKSKYNMQDAANALQWHLHEGLCQNYQQDIEMLNVLPVGSFPQYYDDAFIQEQQFASNTGNNNVNVGFCNVKFIRKYILPRQVYKALIRSFMNEEEGILFVYTISSTFMQAVSKIKRKKPDIKVCAIIADLPDMSSLSSNKSKLQKKFEKNMAAKSYRNLSCIDAYVLLTKYMADYMKINKPFCVVEGIATPEEEFGRKLSEVSETRKVVMYTGTLHKRFGILNLVNAFQKIRDKDYRLVICGTGDSENEILEAAKRDNRIMFLGQLSRKDVLELEKKATVLVNPRQNNEEFTKYSFPSKVMEYLSSGVPVVAYRLDGVPAEYEKYLFYVEGDTLDELANKLVEVCELSPADREKIGGKGREFVLNEKNSIIQTEKILRLLDGI